MFECCLDTGEMILKIRNREVRWIWNDRIDANPNKNANKIGGHLMYLAESFVKEIEWMDFAFNARVYYKDER